MVAVAGTAVTSTAPHVVSLRDPLVGTLPKRAQAMLTSRPEQLGQRGVSLFDAVTKVVAAGVFGIEAIA